MGRPMPGVAAKIVDLETGEDLGRRPSRACCWIKGPNVMQGYLGTPGADRRGDPRRLVRDRRRGA